MCGIVGYLGNKEAYPILINGLKRLEYRGYDSSGIALFNGDIEIYKCKGKVERLESLKNKDLSLARLGIGHTRWATHGPPNNKVRFIKENLKINDFDYLGNSHKDLPIWKYTKRAIYTNASQELIKSIKSLDFENKEIPANFNKT